MYVDIHFVHGEYFWNARKTVPSNLESVLSARLFFNQDLYILIFKLFSVIYKSSCKVL